MEAGSLNTTQSFFELGGTSVNAVQVVEHVETELGCTRPDALEYLLSKDFTGFY